MNLLQLYLKRILLYSCVFFASCTLFGQTVKNLTLSDGLPGNSIKCLYKDSKGLMWIATDSGLCTYDGNKFNIIGEDQGLKHNQIWKITEDDKKNIWLSTYSNGVAKFDGKKYIYYDKKNGLVNNSVRTLFFSKEHNCMLFGTENGLSVFDGKQFKNFKLQSQNQSGKFQVNYIAKYFNNVVIATSYDNLYELQIDKNNIQKSKIIKKWKTKTQNYSGFIKGESYFNVNYTNQFEIHNLATGHKKSLGKCSAIWDFVSDNHNTIYGAGWNGTSPTGGIITCKNNKLTDLSKQLNLSSSQFWCLYFDKKSSQLWAGSVDQGVFIIDLSNKFQLFDANFFKTSKIEINSISIDSNQNLWLGCNNFIIKKNNSKTQIINNERLAQSILHLLRNKNDKNSIWLKKRLKEDGSFICNSIKEDTKGNMWAMTNYGLICIDNNFIIKQFTKIDNTSGFLDFVDSNHLFVSPLYSNGLIISVKNLDIKQSILKNNKPIGLDANKIFKGKKNIWIASYSKGLMVYDNSTLLSMTDLGYLNENNITEVIEDSQQNIIVGTINGKVYFSKWKNHKLEHYKILYPEKDLVGNSIFFIRQFEDYYFIATNKGINILKDFKLFKFIDKTENLLQTQYFDAVIDAQDKKLLIASYKGIISLDLKAILKTEKVNNPLHFTKIKVNDKVIAPVSSLTLKHNENNIEIYFNSNNTYNSSKNQYRYKIIGLSKSNWSKYTTETSLKLFGLESGKYTFILEGKNIGTNETIAPIKFQFTILTPFYKTIWFIGLLLLIFISLGLLYNHRKIIRIKNKADLEKRLAQTKLQALQSQMNPHFIFNAMNSIQNFVIDNKTDDALWYIGEFSKLMRQTLDFSSKKSISLEEEIDYLKRYIELENLRRKHTVNYDIKLSDSIDSYEIQIPPLLIEPLVENVFVHAFDTTVVQPEMGIEFSIIDNYLICSVTDNGKGYESSNKSSKGLKLVKERILLLEPTNKNCLRIKKLEIGTRILIEIPLR